MASASDRDGLGQTEILLCGDFLARRIHPTPHGDGEIWHRDWNVYTLEAFGKWDDIKRAVQLSARHPSEELQ